LFKINQKGKMKKITLILAIVAFVFSACTKDSPDSAKSTSIATAKLPVPDKKPEPDPTPLPAEPFSAKFRYTVPDPNNIFENQKIQFNSVGSGIVSWVWQFGNGAKLYTPDPDMSYIMHGFYNVTLTVTDKNGNTATATQQLSILCNFGGNH
jgi:PKD repeat protein